VSFKENYKRVVEAIAQQDYSLAIGICRQILEQFPQQPDTLNLLGACLWKCGDYKAATEYLQQAIMIKPGEPGFYTNLGNVLREQNLLSEACEFYQKALDLDSKESQIYLNIAQISFERGFLHEAVNWCQKGLQFFPEFVELHKFLGICLLQQGHADQAIQLFEHYVKSTRVDSSFYSGYLTSILYTTATEKFLEVQKQWGERFEKPPAVRRIHYSPATYPKHSKLRVGYVSPDFWDHAVTRFMLSILQHTNRIQFEIYCYSNTLKRDATTEQLMQFCPNWRVIKGLSVQEAIRKIREDEIDILVDLAGHTADNSLLVFAHKAAPIQVSYLGYPASTGLETIDYKISDIWTDPPFNQRFYTEKLEYIEGGFLCYKPYSCNSQLTPLPMLRNGFPSFGCFNDLKKISSKMLELWVQILKAAPTAHFAMKNRSFGCERTKSHYLQYFEQKGIAPERLHFFGFVEQERFYQFYNNIDLALDSYPYNGTTTTCDALWMGIPTVTMQGEMHVSRIGASLLKQVELGDFIASSPEEYVSIAVQKIQDIPLLLKLKIELRAKMLMANLGNPNYFVPKLESFYERIWQKWLQT
jgi:predicted O-linked N-acetylglucosamine transferase (SPINDLY family)